jgi:S-formylglutathione hydrolase FrmB
MRWCEHGGYSAFYLAGIHNNRFKTFIAHDGVFNTQSMFGTTEEVFFANWDLWRLLGKDNAVAQKTYTTFFQLASRKWNTPILIFQGGDFVPNGQGQKLSGSTITCIKSRFVYFPEENHGTTTSKCASMAKSSLNG